MKTAKERIKVLVVDDHAIVRAGLVSVLGFEHDIVVVGEAYDGEQAVEQTERLHPDVVIMDLMMPRLDGAAATARIRRSLPDTKVIILTTYGSSSEIRQALKAGAAGAISKSLRNEELTTAIRAVAEGRQVISNDIRRTLDEAAEQPDLTTRQQEILQSVTRGLTNQDIARQYGITVSCVKQHLIAVFSKLGAANRAEAISIALRRSVVKL